MANPQTGVWEEFSGPNAAYMLDLYERYRENPDGVDPATREFFERWGIPRSPKPPPGPATSAPPPPVPAVQIAGAAALAAAIRAYGHRAARLDPLGSRPPGDVALRPDTHGIREEDLAGLPAGIVGGPMAADAAGGGNAL